METCKENTDDTSGGQCAALLLAVGDALYSIGGKWKLRVIIGLYQGNKRFNELQRTVPGISSKVLSKELKELELNGFVKRIVFADANPVMVEYELTDYSRTLKDVVNSLNDWGVMHRQTLRNKQLSD